MVVRQAGRACELDVSHAKWAEICEMDGGKSLLDAGARGRRRNGGSREDDGG